MIKSFADKKTENLYKGIKVKQFANIARAAGKKLSLLEAATELSDLAFPPGNRLETLKGNRIGQYSIRINDQFRICFRFEGRDAYGVEIVDYH